MKTSICVFVSLFFLGFNFINAQELEKLKLSRNILPVDSPAFVFSPGTWTGDEGRGGTKFRQSWYPGAYFRATWTSGASEAPTAEILLEIPDWAGKIKNPPELTYCIDGLWTTGVKVAESIPVKVPPGSGPHTLSVYFKTSEQNHRWGTVNESGLNVVKVIGLRLDEQSMPVPSVPAKRWALIVGDSITEGSAADNGRSDQLASWGYFVGTALQGLGYEYGISACGYSGWLRPGDAGGDVPPYYQISKSLNGTGGIYDDVRSRWNKIDARNSLMDADNRISAYGQTGQAPSVILINFGTNDGLKNVNSSDLRASIAQALEALRKSAPESLIMVIVPFGQYAAEDLKAGVEAYEAANRTLPKVKVIDLGPEVAKGLAANNYWSGLHPNMRGHATFASRILAELIPALSKDL